jgi:polyvinyl alcohol dehydrogenase (cytochrome)
VLLAILSCAVLAAVPLGGYNLNNNRYSDDQYITKANVNTLRVKWRYTSNGDISATPAVVNVNGKDIAFFPDWYGLV